MKISGSIRLKLTFYYPICQLTHYIYKNVGFQGGGSTFEDWADIKKSNIRRYSQFVGTVLQEKTSVLLDLLLVFLHIGLNLALEAIKSKIILLKVHSRAFTDDIGSDFISTLVDLSCRKRFFVYLINIFLFSLVDDVLQVFLISSQLVVVVQLWLYILLVLL